MVLRNRLLQMDEHGTEAGGCGAAGEGEKLRKEKKGCCAINDLYIRYTITTKADEERPGCRRMPEEEEWMRGYGFGADRRRKGCGV